MRNTFPRGIRFILPILSALARLKKKTKGNRKKKKQTKRHVVLTHHIEFSFPYLKLSFRIHLIPSNMI